MAAPHGAAGVSGSGTARAQESTTYQRAYCRSLLRQAELPTDRVTVMHRKLFQRIGIEWRDNQRMDGLLASIDMRQIDALIRGIRADYLDEEEEE